MLLVVEQFTQVIVAGDAQDPIPLDLIHEVKTIDPAVNNSNHLDTAKLIGVRATSMPPCSQSSNGPWEPSILTP